MHPRSPLILCLTLVSLSLTTWGCAIARGADERHVVAIDGSSTVFPLVEAAVESYGRRHRARVTVKVSGTSGGFEKLCRGEVSIIGASRPIVDAEAETCRAHGIAFIELPVAVDGITVVVHRNNDWVDALTLEELRTLWAPEGAKRVRTWRDLRPGLPAREIHLFATGGMESGTYHTFVDRVLGGEGSRSDYTSSENDALLVEGVARDRDALGIFGFVYYAQHRDQLRAVPIASTQRPVAPSPETIGSGTYEPLSRPLFLYVNRGSADLPPVSRFVRHVLEQAPTLAHEAGYVALPEAAYPLVQRRFEQRRVGSLHHSPAPRSSTSLNATSNASASHDEPLVELPPVAPLTVSARGPSERLVEAALTLCGLLSLGMTAGLVLTLLIESSTVLRRSLAHLVLGRSRVGASRPESELRGVAARERHRAHLRHSDDGRGSRGAARAIYLAEFASPTLRRWLKPALEVLAGVPTIVFGYFALIVVTPSLQVAMPGLAGFNALSAGLVVGLMLTPMISSLGEDAISAVPEDVREAAYALGADRLTTIFRIVLPAASSGIGASILLALGRALGETMIVAIAAGHQARLTADPTVPIETMTGYVLQVASSGAPAGTLEYRSIFAVGAVLFVVTLVINVLAQRLRRRARTHSKGLA